MRTSRSCSRNNSTAAILGLNHRKELTDQRQTLQKISKRSFRAQFYWPVSRIAVAVAWAAVITRVGRTKKSSGIYMTSRQAPWIPSNGLCHRRKDRCSNSNQISGRTIGVSCSSSLSRTNLAPTTSRSSRRGTTHIKQGRSTL